MNFPIGESGRSGARSWTAAPVSPGADSIASRTPCSSLVSTWVATRPSVSAYQVMAASRSGTAMPTWSTPVTKAPSDEVVMSGM